MASVQSLLSPSNSLGFSSWSNRLADVTILGRPLPLLAGQLGSQYSPRPQLNTLLTQLGGPYTTLDQLETALDGIAGIDVLATRMTPNETDPSEVELDLRFQKTVTLSVPVAAAFGGVNFAATGSWDVSVGWTSRSPSVRSGMRVRHGR